LSFIGSDDPITSNAGVAANPSGSNIDEYDCVNAGKGPDCIPGTADDSPPKGWGPAIQIPMLIGAVSIGYQRGAGGVWNEQGSPAAGNTSHLDLDTNAWCGIFTGAITDWNDPAITGTATSGNHGISITGGFSSAINVVYRGDGSGTTFL